MAAAIARGAGRVPPGKPVLTVFMSARGAPTVLSTGPRGACLLDGYRGQPPGDRAALVQLIQRLSALVEVIPELRELDLNPVKVLPPSRGAVVVDARVSVGSLGAS